jgi:hypothetical protein
MSKRSGALNKRFQTEVYKYLSKEGMKNTREITDWYNDRLNKKGMKAKDTISCIRAAAVLNRSILFEKKGNIPHQYTSASNIISLWDVRPINAAVDKVILSKKQLHRFPKFLRDAVVRRVENVE